VSFPTFVSIYCRHIFYAPDLRDIRSKNFSFIHSILWLRKSFLSCGLQLQSNVNAINVSLTVIYIISLFLWKFAHSKSRLQKIYRHALCLMFHLEMTESYNSFLVPRKCHAICLIDILNYCVNVHMLFIEYIKLVIFVND